MRDVRLTQDQIDWIAAACVTAIDEHARFLDEDVQRTIAQALRAMGKTREAWLIDVSAPEDVAVV